MLVFRYFFRELMSCLFLVTFIVLLVFLGNQLVRYLNNAAAGNMALGVLGQLLLLEIPYLLTLLLPLTFFIALLLTLGRLSADHEWIVLQASGLSQWQQWKMLAKPCLILTLLVAVLALWVQPHIAVYRNQLLATTNAGASIQSLVPGKFQATKNDHLVFYIAQSSVDHKHLHDIFVGEKRLDLQENAPIRNQWNIIKAHKGELIEDPETHAQYIQVSDGNRYLGEIGQANYQVMHFDQYDVLARSPPITEVGNQLDALNTWPLLILAKTNVEAVSELEWRMALPFSCFLLSILGLLIGPVPPRHGRYARLLPGILLLIIYINMLFVTRSWVMRGDLSPFPGIGWVPLALTGLILLGSAPWRRLFSKKMYWRGNSL